jgi:hypothetical protein
MNTIKADDVRIPRRAREAVARHEVVVVLNRDRPVYVLSNPDDRRSLSKSPRSGRPLREAMAVLAAAPLPDDKLGLDLESIRESVGPLPA